MSPATTKCSLKRYRIIWTAYGSWTWHDNWTRNTHQLIELESKGVNLACFSAFVAFVRLVNNLKFVSRCWILLYFKTWYVWVFQRYIWMMTFGKEALLGFLPNVIPTPIRAWTHSVYIYIYIYFKCVFSWFPTSVKQHSYIPRLLSSLEYFTGWFFQFILTYYIWPCDYHSKECTKSLLGYLP